MPQGNQKKGTKQKRAFITGITGQDGSYLAEFLLEKGYKVYGMTRRSSTDNLERIEHLKDKMEIVHGDLVDQSSITSILKEIQPDEIYNLAAQSFVKSSWSEPLATGEYTALGVLRVLEAMRQVCPKAKFYQASSSEMFGIAPSPQNEKTPFHPRSPYAVSKVFGHYITINYRESYGLFACCGILFNHESPRRGLEFVTRKISDAVAKIKLGLADELRLGNMDAKRDWGYAGDYCIDLDTSILTIEGFKWSHEIKIGDIVLNYNPQTDRLEQDRVLKKIFISNRDKMYLFQGRGLELRCSANHRIYYQRKSKTSKGGWSDWKVCEAQDFYKMTKDLSLRTKYDFRLPHTQGYKNKDLKIKEEWFKLIGYLLSEGSLYDGQRNLRVTISQSKIVHHRVYQDIRNCLKLLNLNYRLREKNDGLVEFIFDSRSSKEIISYFDGFDIHQMPQWVYNAGHRQLKILLEAMMDGDGSWGAMAYITKRKDLIFSFQTIATILGYRTIVKQRKSGIFECVLIPLRKKYGYVVRSGAQKSNEKLWCITTRNGTIVTNKNGGIAVSGNCKAMWLMLQQSKPDDYVVGTGINHSVKEFVEAAFKAAGISDWKKYVKVDPKFLRPADVSELRADASKARKKLGWKPKISFEELVKMMVESDIKKQSVIKAQKELSEK